MEARQQIESQLQKELSSFQSGFGLNDEVTIMQCALASIIVFFQRSAMPPSPSYPSEFGSGFGGDQVLHHFSPIKYESINFQRSPLSMPSQFTSGMKFGNEVIFTVAGILFWLNFIIFSAAFHASLLSFHSSSFRFFPSRESSE